MTTGRIYTIEAFADFVNRPGNEDRLLELIDGEIVESAHVPTWYSQIPYLIGSRIHTFCQERSLICHISGAGGCYDVLGHVIAPKLAYKRTPMSEDFPDPMPPEWVVEVISPNHLATIVRRKRQIYQQAGILLWEMYPQKESIDVYAPGQPVKMVGIDGALDVGDVLPGFAVAVRDLFAD